MKLENKKQKLKQVETSVQPRNYRIIIAIAFIILMISIFSVSAVSDPNERPSNNQPATEAVTEPTTEAPSFVAEESAKATVKKSVKVTEKVTAKKTEAAPANKNFKRTGKATVKATAKASAKATVKATAKAYGKTKAEAKANAKKKALNKAKISAKKKAKAKAVSKAKSKARKKARPKARKKAKINALQKISRDWKYELTPASGVANGPSGKETYYNLPMSGVVSIMRNSRTSIQKGVSKLKYAVRSDGVKTYGGYVMVAADQSIPGRRLGDLVPTSRGVGIVCDTGSFIYSNPRQLDLAVSW